jgi:hypothetical protein
MNAVVEQPMQWRCECGKRMWLHVEHCYECGNPRPAPPPEKEPSDTPLTEKVAEWRLSAERFKEWKNLLAWRRGQ